MEDRLSEIERLNALRERGSITQEEFERAKRSVLGQDAEGPKKIPRWMQAVGSASAIALAVFVIKPMMGTGSPPSATTAQATDESTATAGENDGWTVQSKTDPMTDATLTTADKTFVGGAADIEVKITCSSTGKITYRFASFDKDHDPVEMRTDMNNTFGFHIPFEVRPDNGTAWPSTYSNPQYSNVAEFNTSFPSDMRTLYPDRILGKDIDDDVIAARHVAFALHLAHSDETIIVDQTVISVSAVLKPCRDIRAKQIADAEAQRRAAPNGQTGHDAQDGDEPNAGAL
jgi:hypothetical protein